MAQTVGNSGMIDVFASESGNFQDPATDTVNTENNSLTDDGFPIGARPPAEYFNYYLNLFGSLFNHLMLYGVPQWNDQTNYVVNSYAAHNGQLWKAIIANQNVEPGVNVAEWKAVLLEGDAVPLTRQLIAGRGLIDGGGLDVDRTFNMGTPSTCTLDTANEATGNTGALGSHTHTIAIRLATAILPGILKLVDSNQNASIDSAPTARALKETEDLLQAHRIGIDHDGRYNTKSEIINILAAYLTITAAEAGYKKRNIASNIASNTVLDYAVGTNMYVQLQPTGGFGGNFDPKLNDQLYVHLDTLPVQRLCKAIRTDDPVVPSSPRLNGIWRLRGSALDSDFYRGQAERVE